MIRWWFAAFAGLWLFATPAAAAKCGGDFKTFISAISSEAEALGVSRATISAAFAGIAIDHGTLAFDRAQRHTFNKTFESYVATRVNGGMVSMGLQRMKKHAAVMARIDAQYQVPAAIYVALWGLETGFGADTGNKPIVRVLATLAHDCRRTELFQKEVLAALQILQRGDLKLSEMRGGPTGEIGQTQFLPSSYYRLAVDYDGDGKADLIHSVPDVLASTANFIKSHGWNVGQPWNEGTANFDVLREWNRALVYRKTIAYFADRLSKGR